MCLSDERRSRPSESHMKKSCCTKRFFFFFLYFFFFSCFEGMCSLPVRCTGSAGLETSSLHGNKGKRSTWFKKKKTQKKNARCCCSLLSFYKMPREDPSPPRPPLPLDIRCCQGAAGRTWNAASHWQTLTTSWQVQPLFMSQYDDWMLSFRPTLPSLPLPLSSRHMAAMHQRQQQMAIKHLSH